MRKELVVYTVYLYVLNKFAEVEMIDWDSALVDDMVNKIINQAESVSDVCEEVYGLASDKYVTIREVDMILHNMHVKDPKLRAEALQLLASIGAFESIVEFETRDYVNCFSDSDSAKEVVNTVNNKLAQYGYEFQIKYRFIYAYNHIQTRNGAKNYHNFILIMMNDNVDPKLAERIAIKYIKEAI